jgi:signal transduction histidine kinase/PAS domain-containing protein
MTMEQAPDTNSSREAQSGALELLNDAFQTLDEGLVLCDSQLRLVMHNENYVDMMHPRSKNIEPGTSAQDLACMLAQSGDFIVIDDMTKNEWAETVLEGVINYSKNVVMKRTDGRLFLASSHKTRLGGYLISIKDVSEKYRAEQAKRESDDLLKTIVDACPVNFMVSRVEDGKIIYRSIASTARFGEIESARKFFLKPQDRQTYLDALLPTGAVDDYPVRFRKGDGSIMEGLTSARVTTYKGENVIVSSTRDITELKRAHQAEREAAELLRNVVNACPANLLMSRIEDGEVLYRSPASSRLFGDKPSARGHWQSPNDRINYLKALETDGQVDDMFVFGLKADGVAFPSQVSARIVEHRGERVVVSSTTDLTEAFARRKEIEQANTRFSEAINALDEGLILLDSNMRFVMENARARELFSSDSDRARIGEPIADLIVRFLENGVQYVPDGSTVEQIVQLWIGAITGHSKDLELELADGRIIICSSHHTSLDGYLLTFKDVSGQRLTEASKLEAVYDAIQALDEGLVLYDSDLNFIMGNAKLDEIFYSGSMSTPEVGESAFYTMNSLMNAGFYAIPKGTSKAAFLQQMMDSLKNYAKGVTVSSSGGRVYNTSVHKTALDGYLVSFSDITEQRKVEHELANQREIANQNEKLSALGELLAGVAHELNNPLSIVVGYAQMIQGRVDDPVINRRIERIGQAADRSAKIVKTFLAMARQKPARLIRCSLNDTVETALDVAGYGLRSAGVNVVVDLADALPPVTADGDQLAQVFTNLIINAEHALAKNSDTGELRLSTFHDQETNEVVAEVCDNGDGIPNDIKSRIFEPFFTTKEINHGTGVGLAFSHRVIDSHGGTLTVHSVPGEGANFFVRLPATPDVGDDTANSPIPHPARNPCRVLVIDDEEYIAELVRDLLEEAHYKVTTVSSARTALNLIGDEHFDVILSDFKMPGLDGQDLYRALMDLDPGLIDRLGYIAGDTMGQKVTNFFKSTGSPYIEKPVSAPELFALVAQLDPNTMKASHD